MLKISGRFKLVGRTTIRNFEVIPPTLVQSSFSSTSTPIIVLDSPLTIGVLQSSFSTSTTSGVAFGNPLLINESGFFASVNCSATLGQPELILDEAYTYPLASIAIFAFEPEEQEVQALWQDPEAETDPITEAGQRIAGVRDFRSDELVAFNEFDAGPLWFGPDQGFSPDPVYDYNGWFYEWLEVPATNLQGFDGVLIVATTQGTYPLEINLPEGTQYAGDIAYYLLPVISLPVLAYLFYPNQTFGPTIDAEIARLEQRGAGPARSLAGVEDLSYVWAEMGLKRFPLIDVSSGTNFEYAWRFNPEMIEFPEISFPSGASFDSAWQNCSDLQSFPQISAPVGENFQSAWRDCTSLQTFPQLEFPVGTNFQSAWRDCTSLQTFPQLEFPVGTNFNSAWQDCTSLQTFPQISIPVGTSFVSAWQDCTSLQTFPQIQLPAGVNFFGAWRDCTSLQTFPLLEFPLGTDFTGAWAGCTSLQTFPLLEFPVGTDFTGAWRDCTSLQTFPLLEFPVGTDFDGTWAGCTSLQSFPLLDFPVGTSFGSTWAGCISLQSFPQIQFPAGVNFFGAWAGCTNMTTFSGLNFSAPDLIGAVGSFDNGFLIAWRDCINLANIPAGIFDNCLSTNFQNAFVNCALTQQSVDNILISLVTANQNVGRIDITGGTSSAPSSVGLSAKSTLQNRGWIVNTN